jgi:hypothetical protein
MAILALLLSLFSEEIVFRTNGNDVAPLLPIAGHSPFAIRPPPVF